MTARPLLAAWLLTAAAHAGSSADYTLEPVGHAIGGLSGSSASYDLTSSTTPGGHGGSASYTARTGFAGQLGGPIGISIFAAELTLDETSTLQLTAEIHYDDGSSSPLSDVNWSIISGPVADISSTGLATAGAVYQDTPAVVRAGMGSFTDDLTLTILDIDPDNYATYAADGLPDLWQVQYFGVDSPKAGKFDDFDGDSVGNLIEFANGTHPASGDSGIQPLRFEGGALVSPGLPALDFSPTANALDYQMLFIRRKDPAARLDYDPQFSRNLIDWSNATTPLTVIADDGTFEVVSVRFPVLIGGRRSSSKFFRLNLSITSP